MGYVWLAIQIITAIPDLIRAYREIKKLVDENEKDAAKEAVREITRELKVTGDAKRFKENLVAIRTEIKTSLHA